MRIAYLVSTLQRTGPTRQLLNIVRCAQRDGCHPLVMTLSPEPEESLRGEFIEQGVELIDLNMSRWATLQYAGPTIADLCRAKAIDVVHSQGVRSDTIAARFLKGCATVATLRNIPWLDYRMTYGRLKGAAMSWGHLRALARVTRVVTVSHAVAAELADKVERLSVIQNGVDVDYYDPFACSNRDAVRAALGIPQDATVFVSVGHLSERKDPETVLRAFVDLENGGNYALILVGDGPLRSRCESTANRYTRVIGRQADVRPFLAAADVFISGSRAEGFPNAALEAASMGLPLILSDIGPHTELANTPALDCVIFRAGAAPELTRQMAARARFQNTKRTNRQAAIAELSMGIMGKRYLSLYRALIEAKGAGTIARERV